MQIRDLFVVPKIILHAHFHNYGLKSHQKKSALAANKMTIYSNGILQNSLALFMHSRVLLTAV